MAAAGAPVEAAAGELGLTEANGYRLRLTGEPLMLQDELVSVSTGIGIVGLISALLVALVLFAGLRGWRLAVPILVKPCAGPARTAGFAALAVGGVNLISIPFPVPFLRPNRDIRHHPQP